ncbi:MAG: CocE/NonD family hydrolase [Gemmatimonadaceae bacterium]
MNTDRIRHRVLLAVAVVVVGTGGLVAQTPAAAPTRTPLEFDKREVMIPMRDGVKLHTLIYTQKGITDPRPLILTRTPYGIAGSPRTMNGSYAELSDDGYIFVFQDIRGRFTSEGQFEMLRPPRNKKVKGSIDEGTDTYDTIDWLLKNVPGNSGKAGMLGVSYPGWLTVMATLDPHPALKAVSPQASPADMFIGDDFHHNGAFRLSYGFEYAAMMEAGKELKAFEFDKPDLYDWYLNLGSLSHIDERYLKGKFPSWTNFATHSSYDKFWQKQSVTPYLTNVNVPMLNVGGWWDQEDFYGPIKIYETLEPHDTKHLNYLVVGPWNHGGWNSATGGQKLGNVDFGSATSAYFRKNIQAPWFAYWLKDKGTLNLAEATTFEAGSNSWQSHDRWPPKANISNRRLYPQANGLLSFDAPSERGEAFDAYVSDPANPVPYRARPILPSFTGPSTWGRWLVDDQRFLEGRKDVVSWQTPPLTEDISVAGQLVAHLFAATSGTDADWVVKLIDVYPDKYEADSTLNGYQLMVANDVTRGRFRKSLEKPEAIPANKIEEYTLDLHTQSYRFLKGHRIMVQVQSSWFPLIDRNPQTFVPNIFAAPDSVFKPATQKVYRAAGKATFIEVPVVRNSPLVP